MQDAVAGFDDLRIEFVTSLGFDQIDQFARVGNRHGRADVERRFSQADAVVLFPRPGTPSEPLSALSREVDDGASLDPVSRQGVPVATLAASKDGAVLPGWMRNGTARAARGLDKWLGLCR